MRKGEMIEKGIWGSTYSVFIIFASFKVLNTHIYPFGTIWGYIERRYKETGPV